MNTSVWPLFFRDTHRADTRSRSQRTPFRDLQIGSSQNLAIIPKDRYRLVRGNDRFKDEHTEWGQRQGNELVFVVALTGL